ncbi:MAG: hypothetical protein WC528_04705 [Patescibacteria group bacterium]
MKPSRNSQRISQLRGILSRLPTSIDKDVEGRVSIQALLVVGPVLHDLDEGGYISLNCRPWEGNYSFKPGIPSLNDERIRKGGAEITVSPGGASDWQWTLIKRALVPIGFRHTGRGQSDWYLILYP